jgi:hypothetical protein
MALRLRGFLERLGTGPLHPFHITELDGLLGGRTFQPEDWEQLLHHTPAVTSFYLLIRTALEAGLQSAELRTSLGSRDGVHQAATRVARSFRYANLLEAIDAAQELDEVRRLGHRMDLQGIGRREQIRPAIIGVPLFVGIMMCASGVSEGPSGMGEGWLLVVSGLAILVSSFCWILVRGFPPPPAPATSSIRPTPEWRAAQAEERLHALEGETFRRFVG